MSCVVIVALALLVNCVDAFAQNSMSLPQILARAKKNGTVIVTISPIAAGVDSVVIQRKVGKGKFKTVATKKPSGTTVKFTDKKLGKKAQSYRAQFVFSASPSSNWSVESTAEERGPEMTSTALSAGSNCPAGYIDSLFQLINSARTSNGLNALGLENSLQTSAQAHANKMAARGVLSHDGWVEGIRQAGYTSPVIGQNVANGFPTPDSVVNGWLASPGHRANILSSNYTVNGFGCTVDSRGYFWWSNDFGG